MLVSVAFHTRKSEPGGQKAETGTQNVKDGSCQKKNAITLPD